MKVVQKEERVKGAAQRSACAQIQWHSHPRPVALRHLPHVLHSVWGTVVTIDNVVCPIQSKFPSKLRRV